ncbi:MAG: hypothetical protein D3924_12935 [Candidatus Electrothrix sp. AR4]|nr:hypothetical protein [Candidatus Electrothrix sp. AR4]
MIDFQERSPPVRFSRPKGNIFPILKNLSDGSLISTFPLDFIDGRVMNGHILEKYFSFLKFF